MLISPYLLHRDAAAWPDPLRFWPERWLDARDSDSQLHRQRERPARPSRAMHAALSDMGPNGASSL